MKGNQIIMIGERGLFLSDGKKIYFPDRTFNEAKEGFVRNVRVTLDKGTYAFVTGDMVEGVETDIKALSRRLYGISKEMYSVSFNGIDALIIRTYSDVWKVYIGEDEFCTAEGSSMLRWLRQKGKRVDLLISEHVLSWLDEDRVSDDEVMLTLAGLLTYDYVSKAFAVWGNKVVNPGASNEFYRCGTSDVEYVSESIRRSLISDLGSPDKVYGRDEIMAFAKENNIALCSWCWRDETKVGIVERTFKYMNSSYSVKMFGGGKLTLEILRDEELVKVVNESVLGLNKWLKQCGKCTSSRNTGSLATLVRSVKEWKGY